MVSTVITKSNGKNAVATFTPCLVVDHTFDIELHVVTLFNLVVVDEFNVELHEVTLHNIAIDDTFNVDEHVVALFAFAVDNTLHNIVIDVT